MNRMTTVATLPALLALSCSFPSMALEPTPTSGAGFDIPGLTDRVWTKPEDAQLPGVMLIFLSDGTLVQDSCWETHRLSRWEAISDSAVRWNEDGADIDADIVALSETELELSLKLGGDAQAERYVTATVPYVCPDLPRD